MYTPYVRMTSGNPYTILDSVAQNPLGTLYAGPINLNAPASNPGNGAPAVLKYVYYNPTSLTIAPVAAPAPVYWKDESFTTVTPLQSEAMGGGLAVGPANEFIAGWLLPNTTSIPGLVAQATPATPNGLNQSYCWIQIGGFLGGAFLTNAGAVGDIILPPATIIATGWATAATAGGIAPANPTFGRQLTAGTAITGGFTADVLVGVRATFWGS